MNEPRSRFPHERHQQMIDLIVERKRVGTTELASMLGMSLSTVRRDMAVLDRAGLVSRIQGGVAARGNLRRFTPVCPLDAISSFITDRGAEPLLGPYRNKLANIHVV